MTRFALVVLALAGGCNPPVAKDHVLSTGTMEHVEDGAFALAFAVRAGANSDARDLDVEIEIVGQGLVPDGAQYEMVVAGAGVLETAGPTDESAPTVVLRPDFAGCGDGYLPTEDGGCEVELGVVIAGDGAYGMLPTFAIRAFGDKEDREHKDDFEVWIEAVNQPLD